MLEKGKKKILPTMFIAFFTSLMSSKLTVRCTNLLGFSSTPDAPLRGVFVSSKNNIVATNKTESTKVFQIILNTVHMAKNNPQNPPEK
jgi:hypothetical protein